MTREGIGMTSARTRERLTQRLRDKGITSETILELIRTTPRHLFIEEALAHQAYDDTALPIGGGQTISQPWIVARMSELLIEPGVPRRILEVGTGCGYQTAVLAGLNTELYSVERLRSLLDMARNRLHELGLARVQLKLADGGFGWASAAPFDGIIVTCARAEIPPELLDQLGEGGRLVMPVGEGDNQRLTVVDRRDGELHEQQLEPVRFVPFQRGVQR
jgi:protein-L-isoaspartate(D-aspartate) O-methyltransferase